VKTCLTLFVGGTLAFWALAAGLVCLVTGDGATALGYSAAAAGLCLLPSTLTLVWALCDNNHSPEERRLVILGGTGIRLFFVLGAGLALHSFLAYFHSQAFWLWLLVFYLFTLALEIVLVVRALGAPTQRGEAAR
jgi:hypothetical protein